LIGTVAANNSNSTAAAVLAGGRNRGSGACSGDARVTTTTTGFDSRGINDAARNLRHLTVVAPTVVIVVTGTPEGFFNLLQSQVRVHGHITIVRTF
jgi:hypothetical protein